MNYWISTSAKSRTRKLKLLGGVKWGDLTAPNKIAYFAIADSRLSIQKPHYFCAEERYLSIFGFIGGPYTFPEMGFAGLKLIPDIPPPPNSCCSIVYNSLWATLSASWLKHVRGRASKMDSFLIISVTRGAQLLPMDANGLSDPYCEIYASGLKHKKVGGNL